MKWSIFISNKPSLLFLTVLLMLTLAAPALAQEPAFPTTFQDAVGRNVKLEAAPQRIVVIGRGVYMILDILYMFPEAAKRIVGMENRNMDVNAFLRIVDPTITKKQQLQIDPGPEPVMALKPDLVLMKSGVANRTGEALAKFGVPVVYCGLETPGQFLKDIDNAGKIMGNRSRATEITAFYRTRLNRLEQGTADMKPTDKPGVLVLHYNQRGGKAAVRVPAKSWMQTLETAYAGGKAVWLADTQAADGWSIVNFEQIARWNPDVIVVVIWFTLDRNAVMKSLKSDPHWSKLKAVKNNRIIAFPGDVFGWDSPEPRWILGMMWMARQLHPEIFADIDISSQIDAFFTELYHLDAKTIARDILTQVKLSQ